MAGDVRWWSSSFGRYLPSYRRNSGKWVIQGEIAPRDLSCGLGLTVLVTGFAEGNSRDSCHGRRVVHGRRGLPPATAALRRRGRLPEFFLEVGDAVTGSGELGGLREGAGDVDAGVGGFGG